MNKNYNETDCMIIIKKLLNLVCNDKKRYAGLLNKFNKSIHEVTIKEGKIVKVSFNEVSLKILNEEINCAKISLTKYAERSTKKLNEFLEIFGEKQITKKETVKDKTKKETVKDKTKKETVKDKTKKETVKDKGIVRVKKINFDKRVLDFIKYLDNNNPDDVLALQNAILKAFEKDSKLLTTMKNWMNKSETIITAVSGMFNSAYTRRPKNSKLQDWYNKYKKFCEENSKELETEKIIENSNVEKKEIENKLTIYKSLLSLNLLGDMKKYSFVINNNLLQKVFETEENALKSIKQKSIIPSEIEKQLELYLKNVFKKEEQDCLAFEAEMLEKTVESKYKNSYIFNTIYITNLINMLNTSIGLDPKFRAAIKDPELTIQKYSQNTLNLSQLETYVFNRKIITTLINKVLEFTPKDVNNFIKIFNVLGEIVLNINGLADDIELEKEEKNDTIKYSITASEISFIFENTSFIIQKMDPNYLKIYNAIIENNIELLKKLVVTESSLKENVKDFISLDDETKIDNEEIKIIDKKIFYKNKIFKGKLSSEFIKYVAENNKDQINKFKNFIYACSLNPSSESVEELYDFVLANNLKVTPSGTCILYKWVRDSYYDSHSGKFLNKPGLTLYMDRDKVNSNRNETCSNGLHLCSYNYNKFGQRLLLCEVHPKNVVSIPTDYNKSKMRCCEYTVLLDITEYISEMDKNGDFIRKCENLHYNSKILEIEIMKMFPDVKRINSINGLNNMQGKDESELLSKVFDTKKIDEALKYELKENFPSINIIQCEGNSDFLKEELREEDKNNQENLKEPETKILETIEFDKFFNLFMENKITNESFELEDAKSFFNKSKILDDVILSKVLKIQNILSIEEIDTLENFIKILENYKLIFNNELSTAQFDNQHKKEDNENFAENVSNNIDDVKVVERPTNNENESILEKAKSFFKKLF